MHNATNLGLRQQFQTETKYEAALINLISAIHSASNQLIIFKFCFFWKNWQLCLPCHRRRCGHHRRLLPKVPISTKMFRWFTAEAFLNKTDCGVDAASCVSSSTE